MRRLFCLLILVAGYLPLSAAEKDDMGGVDIGTFQDVLLPFSIFNAPPFYPEEGSGTIFNYDDDYSDWGYYSNDYNSDYYTYGPPYDYGYDYGYPDISRYNFHHGWGNWPHKDFWHHSWQHRGSPGWKDHDWQHGWHQSRGHHGGGGHSHR